MKKIIILLCILIAVTVCAKEPESLIEIQVYSKIYTPDYPGKEMNVHIYDRTNNTIYKLKKNMDVLIFKNNKYVKTMQFLIKRNYKKEIVYVMRIQTEVNKKRRISRFIAYNPIDDSGIMADLTTYFDKNGKFIKDTVSEVYANIDFIKINTVKD